MSPCGGIYPTAFGVTAPHGDCMVCGEVIQNPRDGLFVEEWDSFIHRDCLLIFLNSEEGKVVLEHGHAIVIPEIDGSV